MPARIEDEPPVLWRTKLRSTVRGVDHERQVAHCLETGIVGIGWHVVDLPSGASLRAVLGAIEANKEEGWGKPATHIVRRFAEQARTGDFIWTRDTSGRYLLGRFTGPYRYDRSPEAQAVDVHQVRDVEWSPQPLGDLDVPGAVVRAFTGTSTSFCRIGDSGARRLTPFLWEKLRGTSSKAPGFTPMEVLTSLLDPYDVEDLVYVWLQAAEGYLALPRARARDTPAYEFTMIHRESGRKAIAQIKTGAAVVDLDHLVSAAPDSQTDLFAYATQEAAYSGSPSATVRLIKSAELLAFVAAHSRLLPPRVRLWFELATQPPAP